MLAVRCVGDSTDMPLVRSHEEVVYQKRMDAFPTRTFEAQFVLEFGFDYCIFHWPYDDQW